jgi:hypothetical protein
MAPIQNYKREKYIRRPRGVSKSFRSPAGNRGAQKLRYVSKSTVFNVSKSTVVQPLVCPLKQPSFLNQGEEFFMPRKSIADLSIARPNVTGKPTRLPPPADLDATERQLFAELVGACAPDHFRESDLPLLVEYVRQTVLARAASKYMQDTGGPVAGGTVNAWFGIQQRATRSMCVLSTRLRLNPQSRLHAKTVQRHVGYQPPSYYDRMRDHDDA